MCLGLPLDLFPSGFPTPLLHAFRFFPYVLRAPPLSFFLIWSYNGEEYEP
jgi:hypothetical protein